MSDIRCYMRYGNAGQLYRVCNTDKKFTPKDKKVAILTPLITQEEFVDKVGRPYSKMSSSQQQNYHRLASARAMRDKREEEKKQSTYNKEEYKDYIESRKTMNKDFKERQQLLREKQREEKALIQSVKFGRGDKFGDKEDIRQHFQDTIGGKIKEWKSGKKKQPFIDKAIEEFKEESGGASDTAIKDDIMTKGKARLRKKVNMVDVGPKAVFLDKFLQDTGISDLPIYQLGIGKDDEVNANMKKLVNLTNTLHKKMTKGKGEDIKTYSGFIGAFKRYTAKFSKVDMFFKPEFANEQLELIIGKQRDKREEELNKFKEGLGKKYDAKEKQELEQLTFGLKFKTDRATDQLESLRNQAINKGFSRKWVEKNIKIGIDSDGYMTEDSEKIAKKLIKAKEIIENLGEIKEKIKKKDSDK